METRSVITENTSRRTVSHGESYSSVSTSYSTSSEPLALMAEDVTMKQIATARETFSDLETAYRKFKLELENVKEEHRSEVWLYFALMIEMTVGRLEVIFVDTALYENIIEGN